MSLLFVISWQMWPKKIEIPEKIEEKKKEEPEKIESTGDPEIDKMIEDKNLALLEMKRLDQNIVNERISDQIVHLQEVTDKIVACVVEKPGKKRQVRRFFNYYLPTTIKLLNAYDRMDETGISGINIDGTKGKIEEMMDTAVSAYDKQLDHLYKDEALDISTDITVMENLLKSEGLKDQ
jgi:5-bromo-4-chloroindolyl phosphate hydrolysis protein